LAAVEVPPPGAGLKTVTATVADETKSLAKIEALSSVLLTKTVLRVWPFQWTVELLTKFEPFTVNVKLDPPAVALDGERDFSDGTGFGGW